MRKTFSALSLVLSSACSAALPQGVDVTSEFYWQQQAAAPNNPDVVVLETSYEDMTDLCGDDARGCYVPEMNVIVVSDQDKIRIPGCYANTDNCFYTQAETVLHEMVHASGISEHNEAFDLALQQARAYLKYKE